MTGFYALTKIDIAAMRKCDHLVVRRDPDAMVYCTKAVKKTAASPFTRELQHTVPAPVVFADDWRCDNSGCSAFEMLWNFPSQTTPLGSTLATLRAGDEIRFVFDVDGHSTIALAEAGFHADVLNLEVRRNGKAHAFWELAVSVCQGNSARMIKGAVKRAPVTTEGEG